jgi:predicted DsbA family dithiol-disulfide isomerase
LVSALRVPLYYDFASSLCYVAHRVMQRMQDEIAGHGIALEWVPLDLVRLSGWRRGDAIEGVRRENAVRVAKELEVPLRMPGRWMDSRRASAVALALRGTAAEPAWREAVFARVYREGRPIDGPGELEALAAQAGLDLARLDVPRALDRVEFETQVAIEAQVTGVPTFLFDGWPLGGIQEEATMRSLFERYARKKRG